jgi:radical SAM superfamily enzyme YgiQ (UPF0313 family)
MKTLLIGINSKYIHPTLSIYQLAYNTTYPVTLKEFTIKDNVDKIVNYIIDEKPDLVGFSVYIWNINIIREIIKCIRDTNIMVLLGGPEVSYNAKEYILNNEADFVINNEGEESFHLLLAALHNNTPLFDVPNLVYKDEKIVETNTILPNLENVKLATTNVLDYKNRIVYLESSRGCPYRCSYCVASTSNKVRMFPLDRVLNILNTLMKERVKTVKFLDRTFNADPKYLITILDYIEENNISTTFQFEIVVDRLTKEMLDKIKNYQQSTLRFEIGIQSTNDIVNKSIRRTQNMEKVKENILYLNSIPNLELHVDLIAGLPYEDISSFRNSFNETFSLFSKELQLGFLKFLKGTHLMTMIDEHEYIYDHNPPYEIIQNKYLSKEELREIHKVEETLEKFYNSGIFKNFWSYFKNNQVIDYYQFFLDLYNYLDSQNFSFLKYQIIDLFISLNNFIKDYFVDIYNVLYEQLIVDYYTFFKTKPKLWGIKTLTKEEKQTIYPYIINNLTNYTIEDLYRYALVFELNNKIFVFIYQDFKCQSFIIEK